MRFDDVMGLVHITLAVSLDGYVTGADPTPEQPLGTAGDVIAPGGERWMAEKTLAEAGAVVAGRRTYDHVHGWGEEPPFRLPVFVPTHRPQPVREAGATTFTFVPDVGTAIAAARDVAGDADVYVMGGARTADQALALGLVDEVRLHVFPVLLGAGEQLFTDLGGGRISLERTELVGGPRATHVVYRVRR